MTNNHINYIELPAEDLSAIKTFYQAVFAWHFTDFGDEYVAFNQSGLDGGFYQASLSAQTSQGAPLVVLYHDDLETIQQTIIDNGGTICREIFAFPGGRRFHFTDVCGNELAVWSDAEMAS